MQRRIGTFIWIFFSCLFLDLSGAEIPSSDDFIGSADGPPRIVALVPLCSFANTATVRDALLARHDDVSRVTQEVLEH